MTVFVEPELTDEGARALLITKVSEDTEHGWDARVVLSVDTLRLAISWFVTLPVAHESFEPVLREVVASVPTPITRQGG